MESEPQQPGNNKDLYSTIEEPISCFINSDEEICKAATIALTQLGDTALFQLIGALDSPEIFIRNGAIQTLGYFGDRRAVEPLIAMLEGEGTRYRAVCALGDIADSRAVMPLILLALNDHNQYFLGSDQPWQALGQIGEEAVLPLIAVVNHDLWDVRCGSIQTLGSIKDGRAIPHLIAALKDEDSTVRSLAANALGDLKDKCAIAPLITAAENDEDKLLRAVAVHALGEFGGNRAFECLTSCLTTESNYVREFIVQALGKLNDKRALPVLKAIIESETGNVRYYAEKAVYRIAGSEELYRIKAAIGDR